MKRLQNVLSLLAALTLLALLIAPQTRWLVVMQVGSALHLCHPFTWVTDDQPWAWYVPEGKGYTALPEVDWHRHQAATVHDADSLPVQMAVTVRFSQKASGEARGLRLLLSRFPASPPLYAAILRADCVSTIKLHRSEPDILNGKKLKDASYYTDVSTPSELAAYDQAAGAGERCDPDNAYFPLMRAIGLFADHRDIDARSAIQRASRKPRWAEYREAELEGRWHLRQEAFGDHSAINKAGIRASLLYPYWFSLRAAAGIAVYQAMRLEQTGQFKKGLAIREAVFCCGSLMRKQSKASFMSFSGVAIVRLSMQRPGGTVTSKVSDEQFQDKAAQARLVIYCAYLNRHGDLRGAQEARTEWAAGQMAGHVMGQDVGHCCLGETSNQVFANGPYGVPMGRLIVRWMACFCLLSNILWLLLLGGLASAFTHANCLRDGQTLAKQLKVKIGTALVIGLAVWGIAAYWQASPIRDLLAVMVYFEAANYLTMAEAVWGIPAYVGFASVPGFLLLFLTVRSLILRIPLLAGLIRGFQATALPLACLLFLLYGGLTLSILRQERIVSQDLEQMQQGEGRYYAALTGQVWPQ